MHIAESLQHRLGWCPNHPSTSLTPSKMHPGMYIIAAICVMVILVASPLIIHSPTSQNVAVWAFRNEAGTLHFIARLPATEDATGKLSFPPKGQGTVSLPAGKYRLVIEHPDGDGGYRLMLDGEWVTNRQVNPIGTTDPTKLFKISGAGSLQEKDAYEALIASFSGGERPMTGTAGSGGITEREYQVEK